MSKVDIRAEIDERIAEHFAALDISAEHVLSELAEMAFANVGESFRYSDKIKSLELLGRYLKLWTDKIEHDVTPDLQVDVRGLLERAAQRGLRYQPDATRLSDAELETLNELLEKANFEPLPKPDGGVH